PYPPLFRSAEGDAQTGLPAQVPQGAGEQRSGVGDTSAGRGRHGPHSRWVIATVVRITLPHFGGGAPVRSRNRMPPTGRNGRAAGTGTPRHGLRREQSTEGET